jgi:single-strand DNA-binding protein
LANLNRIILAGRLAADPEARTTVDGLPITKFRLAVDRPYSGGEKSADLFDVVAWRRLAEVCGEYLKKGQLILVEGQIQNRSFDDQAGQRRWATEIVARNMTMLEKARAVPPAVSTEDELVEDDADLPF